MEGWREPTSWDQEALGVAQQELRFHAERLRGPKAQPKNAGEEAYLRATAAAYEAAAATLDRLRQPEVLVRANELISIESTMLALGRVQGALKEYALWLEWARSPETDAVAAEWLRQAKEYRTAAKAIGRLWGYQKSRLERRAADQRPLEMVPEENGVVAAVTEDEP
jgi:hypothetical protein